MLLTLGTTLVTDYGRFMLFFLIVTGEADRVSATATFVSLSSGLWMTGAFYLCIAWEAASLALKLLSTELLLAPIELIFS